MGRDYSVDRVVGPVCGYLNELKTTAALIAAHRHHQTVDGGDLQEAHRLLAAQFKAGEKNHAEMTRESGLGFQAA